MARSIHSPSSQGIDHACQNENSLRSGLFLLLAVFALALGWAAAQAWIDAQQAARAVGEFNRLSDAEIEPLHETQHLLLATLRNMDNAYIDLQRGNQVEATDYTRQATSLRTEAMRVFKAWQVTASRDIGAGDEVQRIVEAYERYASVVDSREEALYEVSPDEYVAATKSAEQVDATFQAALRKAIEVSKMRGEQMTLVAEARARRAGLVAMVFFALSLLLITVHQRFFDFVVLGTLNEVDEQLERIAGGGSGGLPAKPTNNEISALRQALERTRADLARTVTIVRNGEVNARLGDVARDDLELSGRTEQQAAALEQTAATLEEVAVVRQNADNTHQADTLAKVAKGDATRGREIVAQVALAMNAVSAGASRISETVGVIDSIAFQTNVLALTASVEAVRAREFSRSGVRLRRALSAHEIAVLLLLSSAPVELTAGTPDFLALQDDGLVRVVESHYALTEVGSALLHRLGRG